MEKKKCKVDNKKTQRGSKEKEGGKGRGSIGKGGRKT